MIIKLKCTNYNKIISPNNHWEKSGLVLSILRKLKNLYLSKYDFIHTIHNVDWDFKELSDRISISFEISDDSIIDQKLLFNKYIIYIDSKNKLFKLQIETIALGTNEDTLIMWYHLYKNLLIFEKAYSVTWKKITYNSDRLFRWGNYQEDLGINLPQVIIPLKAL